MNLRPYVLVAVAATLLLTGACSQDSKVGGGVKVDGSASGDGPRLGETTTTAAPVATTVAPKTTQPATTQKPAATTTPTTEKHVAITIEIANRSEFRPTIARVPAGSVVRWVNRDTIERQVVANDGAFGSPKIPPGGTFDWVANIPGEHAYSDPDVPFAAGAKVQVG